MESVLENVQFIRKGIKDGRGLMPLPVGYQTQHTSFMKKEKHSWYVNRGYLHFDLPISLKKAEPIVTKPNVVQEHAFYPFIRYQIKTRKKKIKKDINKIAPVEKTRNVSYASHVDSHIYSYYARLLSDKYEGIIMESGISDNVLAFRKLGKCNIDFANNVFNIITEKINCSVLALDISKFFDTLDHHLLKESWYRVLGVERLPPDHYNIFKSLTDFSIVDRDELYKAFNISKNNPKTGRHRICEPTEFRKVVRSGSLIKINCSRYGIPQGSPISALLSNIYMLNFDVVSAGKKEAKNGGSGASHFRHIN